MSASFSVSLATFNVHAGIDGWGQRFDAVTACLDLDADVLVIPESWRGDDPSESIADRVAEIGGYSVIDTPGGRALRRIVEMGSVGTNSWGPPFFNLRGPTITFDGSRGRRAMGTIAPAASSGAWGLALLTRVPLVHQELVPLPQLRHDVTRRHAILTELELDRGRLTVIGAHLGHLLHGSIRQMRTLSRRIKRVEGPCALMGDFNCWGPPLRLVFPKLTDAVHGATWPAWRPHSRIDHVLVPRTLEVTDAQVQPDAGSDHRAIRCVVEIDPRANWRNA